MQPIQSGKYGPGCTQCVCEVGFYYGCKNSLCKNYSPTIIKGQSGMKLITPEKLDQDTGLPAFVPKELFGLYSDPDKRVGRFKVAQDLVNGTWRDLTIVGGQLPSPPNPTLLYGIYLAGVFSTDLGGQPKSAGKVKIRGVRRPIKMTFCDWDATTNMWNVRMNTLVTLT